jgi:hypothetical protein
MADLAQKTKRYLLTAFRNGWYEPEEYQLSSGEIAMSTEGLDREVLRGAAQIALTLYGANTKKNRRRVYYAAEENLLPIWREGALLITTMTALRDHYRRQPDQKERRVKKQAAHCASGPKRILRRH